LLGDTAHPMTPHRGQGGNSAMVDAVKLSDAVLSSAADVERALEPFEREMRARTPGSC
jgi:2-polyprenyl-6-methoxyphenol hydroxylase-like FAD-dependent oxidoreductase